MKFEWKKEWKKHRGSVTWKNKEKWYKCSGEAYGAEGMRLIAYYVQNPSRLLGFAFVADKTPFLFISSLLSTSHAKGVCIKFSISLNCCNCWVTIEWPSSELRVTNMVLFSPLLNSYSLVLYEFIFSPIWMHKDFLVCLHLYVIYLKLPEPWVHSHHWQWLGWSLHRFASLARCPHL